MAVAGGWSMDVCLDLENNVEAVSAARAFVRSLLAAWGLKDHIDDAVLITSELVTNAVLHARTGIELRVLWAGSSVRLEVYDENSRLPILAGVDPAATSGRGLAVVSSVAGSWGMELEGDGKVVWAELGSEAMSAATDRFALKQLDSVELALDTFDRTSRRTATA